MKLNDPGYQLILESIEALAREELNAYALGLALIVEGNIHAIKGVHIPEEVHEEISNAGDKIAELLYAGLGKLTPAEIAKQGKENYARSEDTPPSCGPVTS